MDVEDIDVIGSEFLQAILDRDIHGLRVISDEAGLLLDRGIARFVVRGVLWMA